MTQLQTQQIEWVLDYEFKIMQSMGFGMWCFFILLWSYFILVPIYKLFLEFVKEENRRRQKAFDEAVMKAIATQKRTTDLIGETSLRNRNTTQTPK